MKIAYLVLDSNLVCGGYRAVFEQTNRLVRRGHEVSIWSVAPADEKPAFTCEAPIYYDHTEEGSAGSFDAVVFTNISFVPKFFNSFSTKKYFLLIQHDMELLFQINGQFAELEQIRELFNNFPSSCKILSTSTWIKNTLYERQKLDSILLPYGLSRELFYQAKPILKHSDPSVLIYYDSQIWKGGEDAFATMTLVRQKVKNCRILVFGVGLYAPPTGLRAGENVLFAWPVTQFCNPSQKDLASIYSSATVFVSSSWYEGFGLPGLEAMACGVPVVTTDSGGVRDYAIPEETAIVVPPRDPRALADGIVRVLEDKSLRQKLIKNGLAKAMEFDWEKSIDILEEEFRK